MYNKTKIGVDLVQESPNFSLEGNTADILKTCGLKLTQINLEVTVNNVEDRVMLLEKQVISKQRSSSFSLSLIMLFAIKLIGSKWLCLRNTALYI